MVRKLDQFLINSTTSIQCTLLYTAWAHRYIFRAGMINRSLDNRIGTLVIDMKSW